MIVKAHIIMYLSIYVCFTEVIVHRFDIENESANFLMILACQLQFVKSYIQQAGHW
jgi:hypothetical protein